MEYSSIVECWTDGRVKYLRVWFGQDSWDELTSRVASDTQKCVEKLSLKVQVEVVNVFIISVIYYHLVVVPCPVFWLTKLVHLLIRLLRKGRIPHVRSFTCCHQSLSGELGMPWLLIRRHSQGLRYLQLFLDGKQVWSASVRHDFCSSFF